MAPKATPAPTSTVWLKDSTVLSNIAISAALAVAFPIQLVGVVGGFDTSRLTVLSALVIVVNVCPTILCGKSKTAHRAHKMITVPCQSGAAWRSREMRGTVMWIG